MCSVKSAATPVWCAACSMWGSSGRPLGSVGGSWGCPPVRLGSSARRLRHPPEPSAQFCHDNHEGTDGHAGSRVRVLYNPIGPPAHQHCSLLCEFPCRENLVSSTAHKFEKECQENTLLVILILVVHAKFGSTSPRAPLEAWGIPQAGQSHHDRTTACLTVCLYPTRDPRRTG